MPDQPNGGTPAPKDGANGGGNAPDVAEFIEQVVTKVLASQLADLEKKIDGKLGNAVNSAAKAQTDRQLKALGLTPERLQKLLAPSTDTTTEGDPGEGEGQQQPDKQPKPRKDGAGAQPQPQPPVDMDALRKQIAAELKGDYDKRFDRLHKELNGKVEEERKLREQAERARVEEKGFTKAREVLGKHVLPEALGFAFDALKVRGHLVVDELGEPQFKLGDDDPIPFDRGLKDHFLKSPEAKIFLPAPQPRAPGKEPPRPPLPPLLGGGNGGPAHLNPEAVEQGARQRIGMGLTDALFSGAGTLPPQQ